MFCTITAETFILFMDIFKPLIVHITISYPKTEQMLVIDMAMVGFTFHHA